jgi:hypothetical protein
MKVRFILYCFYKLILGTTPRLLGLWWALLNQSFVAGSLRISTTKTYTITK